MGIYKAQLTEKLTPISTSMYNPTLPAWDEVSNSTTILQNSSKKYFTITQDGYYKFSMILAWGAVKQNATFGIGFRINGGASDSRIRPMTEKFSVSPTIESGTDSSRLIVGYLGVDKPDSANYGGMSLNYYAYLTAGETIDTRVWGDSTNVLWGKNSVPDNDKYCILTIEDDIQPPEVPPTQIPANPRSLSMYPSMVAYDVYQYDVDVTGAFSTSLLAQIKYSDLDTTNTNQGTLSTDFESGEYEINLKPKRMFKKLVTKGNIFFVRRIYEVHGFNNHIPLFPLEQYENVDKQSGNYYKIILTDGIGILKRGIVGNNQNASAVRSTNTDNDTGETSYSWSYGENRNKFITSATNTLTEAITNLFVRTLKEPYKVQNTKTDYVVDNNRKFYGLEFLDASVFDVVDEKKEVAIDMNTTIADAFKIMLAEFNQTNFQPWFTFNGSYFKLEFYRNNEVVFDIQKNKSKILGYTSGVNKGDKATTVFGIGENKTISEYRYNESKNQLFESIRSFETLEDFGSEVGTNQQYLNNLTFKKAKSQPQGYTTTIIFDANFFVGHVTAKVGDKVTIQNGGIVTTQRIKSITEIMDRSGVVFAFDLE